MERVIEVENVVTRFGEKVVHDGVSLHVNRGEIFGLLGPSGCGKTTLMREMILLEHISAGSIRVLGHDLKRIGYREAQALRQSWGVLFQSGALFSSLTVAENIAVMLREYTTLSHRIIDEIVAYKINMVGLQQDVWNLYPSQISGGMKKKTALARALVLDPKLLFLDEPTSGLDPVSARDFDALVVKLKEMLNLSVVMVSHDLASIESSLDTMAIIDEKRIVVQGTLAEVKAADNRFVREFFKGNG